MKNFLQASLVAALGVAMVGCGADDEAQVQNTDVVIVDEAAANDNPETVVAVVEQGDGNPYSDMGSTDQQAQTGQNKDIHQEMMNVTQAGLGAVKEVLAQNDYGSAVDTAKATEVLKASGAAVVQAAAGALGAKAKVGTSTAVQDDGGAEPLQAGWKVLNTTGVRVIDGDTVEILVAGAQSERVRLLGIDAPESKQKYGKQSTETLTSCVKNQPVSILYNETDRYGRLLGIVQAGTTDCNYMQVVQGSAWHYKQYQKGQPKGDAPKYAAAEKDANNFGKGLWGEVNPQAPWDFRKANK